MNNTGGVAGLKKNYFANMKEMRLLGSGQYGKVFLSHNIHNPELKVAIKVLYLDKIHNNKMNLIVD